MRSASATFDYPGAETTFIHRINDKVQIVSAYHEVATDPRHGLLDTGRFRQIMVSGAEATDANGIHEREKIAAGIVRRAARGAMPRGWSGKTAR